MSWFNRIFALALLSLVTACADLSVTPLASNDQAANAEVNIVAVAGRNGQLYTRTLKQRLHVNEAAIAEYDLFSSLSSSSSSTLSVRGASSTLKKMTMAVSFQLLNLKTGEIVLQDQVTSEATLGAVTSYFGQDESERNARARLAQLLGNRVAQRIQLYFISQSGE